jgi:hypothetical protein
MSTAAVACSADNALSINVSARHFNRLNMEKYVFSDILPLKINVQKEHTS